MPHDTADRSTGIDFLDEGTSSRFLTALRGAANGKRRRLDWIDKLETQLEKCRTFNDFKELLVTLFNEQVAVYRFRPANLSKKLSGYASEIERFRCHLLVRTEENSAFKGDVFFAVTQAAAAIQQLAGGFHTAVWNRHEDECEGYSTELPTTHKKVQAKIDEQHRLLLALGEVKCTLPKSRYGYYVEQKDADLRGWLKISGGYPDGSKETFYASKKLLPDFVTINDFRVVAASSASTVSTVVPTGMEVPVAKPSVGQASILAGLGSVGAAAAAAAPAPAPAPAPASVPMLGAGVVEQPAATAVTDAPGVMSEVASVSTAPSAHFTPAVGVELMSGVNKDLNLMRFVP